MLSEYQEVKKNLKKQVIYNFKFDMCNIVVIRPFGSENYIFIPYDRATITNLEQLRSKITW